MDAQERFDRCFPTMVIGVRGAVVPRVMFPGVLVPVRQPDDLIAVRVEQGMDGCIAGWISDDDIKT
jgi:hypothetical protein